MTLGEFLKWASMRFIKAKVFFGHGTDNAWDEAVALALFVLKLEPDKADTSLKSKELSLKEESLLKELVEKRIKDRIPVPYLSHQAWFAGLKFYVDERVLIPRSAFAELIEQGFQPWIYDKPIHRILDLCTGSGCMAIAAACAFREAVVDAVDISKAALEVAEKNVKSYKLENRINLLESDLFEACTGRQYDLIISNPPYVGAFEMESLPKEYYFEPDLALKAGEEGLDLVIRILREAGDYLEKDGFLFVELGNSMEALIKIYPDLPYTWLEFERGGEGIFMLKAEDKACWKIS